MAEPDPEPDPAAERERAEKTREYLRKHDARWRLDKWTPERIKELGLPVINFEAGDPDGRDD